MKYRVSSLLILVGFMLTIVACRPSTQSADEATNEEKLEKAEIEASLKEAAYPLPQPFEVYGMLEDIGASYLKKVLNPVENADKYMTQKGQALAVGVYAADLGYAVTYDNQEDVKAYSMTLRSIVDELGVKIDYMKLQSEQSNANLGDKDSLIVFVTDIFYDTYTFLVKESTPSLAGLMAAGAWTEGLYIATHISDDTFNNNDIVKIIFDQGESLDELIGLLSNFEDDERVKSLKGAFEKLQALYESAGDSLTEEQLNAITSTIEAIRESIVS